MSASDTKLVRKLSVGLISLDGISESNVERDLLWAYKEAEERLAGVPPLFAHKVDRAARSWSFVQNELKDMESTQKYRDLTEACERVGR